MGCSVAKLRQPNQSPGKEASSNPSKLICH